jgi:hypothetical protein
MPAPGGAPTPKSIKTSQIKSRILNVATPNNYIVKFTPPSKVSSFMEDRGLPYNIVGEDIELRCIQTTTPGTSFLTHSVSADHQGIVEEIPYRRAYENEISMTFIVDNNYDTVAFFEAWVDYMSGVGPTVAREAYYGDYAIYRMNYFNDYKSNLFLTKFEKDATNNSRISKSRQDKRALQYTLIGAYPKQINSMDLQYGEASDFMRLVVTFGYSRYVRERVSIKDKNEDI